MKIKIKVWVLSIVFFATLLATAQTRNQTYLLYIDQFYQIAEKQQKKHGIPASIVLAQGLLESGAGQSKLAKMSNNHFGIKCSDWAGEKVYHDDDEKAECFRKYNYVMDSYEDHAMFLINRPRYSFLFNYKTTDYEAWAHGLKKAGYATDPTYAFKLISIIEDYDLHRFDLGKNRGNITSKTDKNSERQSSKHNTGGSMGYIHALANHKVIKVNKVRSVIALKGDTYLSIADEFNINEERVRGFNEVSSSEVLNPGSRVYISLKRRKASKDTEYYTVKPRESMHSIAQNYGVKTESLYILNQMAYSQGAKIGQVLKLR